MQWYDLSVLIVLSAILGVVLSAYLRGRNDMLADVIVSALLIAFLLVTL